MSKSPIRKAVIAAAGFGTRFLPQTKAMPKEMLPLVDKPVIQYVVEELVDSGIEDIIIITGSNKRSIEDHFDLPAQDLVNNLKRGGKSKEAYLLEVEKIANLANFIYVRQKGPYGNAAPLVSVEHLISDEPFIYTFADDFVRAKPTRFRQLIDIYEQYGGSVLACVPASSEDDYQRYGFVGGKQLNSHLIEADRIIEKPGSKADSPSNFASVSGYVLMPELFPYLHRQSQNLKDDEEFVFQESLQSMIDDNHKIYGCLIKDGIYYDTGNKLAYLKTLVDFALMDESISDDFADFLRSKTK